MARGTEDVRRAGRGSEPGMERDDRFTRGGSGLAPGVDPMEPGGRTGADRGGGRGGTAIAWLFGLGVIVAIGIAIWAAVDDSAGPEVGVTLEQIAQEPADFLGQTVTVSGEVDEFVALGGAADQVTDQAGARGASGVAFTLGGDAVGEQVLVIGTNGEQRFIDEDSVVQVTGTVRQFDAAGFTEAFGFGDGADEGVFRDGGGEGAVGETFFDGGFFDGLEGRPAIVAQSIDPTVPDEDAVEGGTGS
jgi:hypothetical protein